MDYYHKLFSLFLKTIDISRSEIKKNREILYNAFYSWLPIYMEQSLEYKQYLQSFLNINLNTPLIAEFDKGYVDSIIDDDATMISNYAHTKGYHGNSLLTFRDYDILVIKINDEIYPLDRINSLITHNPYSAYEWEKAEKIFNSYNGNIIFGVYGNINDYNKKEKIEKLKKLKSNLKNIKEDYNEKEDNYFYVLTRK